MLVLTREKNPKLWFTSDILRENWCRPVKFIVSVIFFSVGKKGLSPGPVSSSYSWWSWHRDGDIARYLSAPPTWSNRTHPRVIGLIYRKQQKTTHNIYTHDNLIIYGIVTTVLHTLVAYFLVMNCISVMTNIYLCIFMWIILHTPPSYSLQITLILSKFIHYISDE